MDTPLFLTVAEAAELARQQRGHIRFLLRVGDLGGHLARPMRVSMYTFCQHFRLDAETVREQLVALRTKGQ